MAVQYNLNDRTYAVGVFWAFGRAVPDLPKAKWGDNAGHRVSPVNEAEKRCVCVDLGQLR
jgi:hypothetical protein